VKRFASQATISAALTETLFTASVGPVQAEAAKIFADQWIDAATVAASVERSDLVYLMILDGKGRPLAASAGTPVPGASRPAHIREALRGNASLSDVMVDGGVMRAIEWAIPFQTPHGRRVAVRAIRATPISQFIGVYLARLAIGERDKEVVIVDSADRLIGRGGQTARAGRQLQDAALRSALAARTQGVYRKGSEKRFFASAPIEGSSWRMVVSRPMEGFYPPLADSTRWLVWALFAAFALALAIGAYLLRQALRRKVKLAETNERLAAMNATLEQQVAERTAAAEKRAEQLARSNAELEQFGYVASHDLQEPLRKIQAFGDRLQAKYGSQLDPEGQEYLRRMQESAKRSRSLINDLLSFSRVTSRAGSFQRVDLTAIAKDAVSDLEIQIRETGGRVEIGELPTIEGDPDQMRRLLQNLVANGIKFHRDGELPVVRVSGRLVNGSSDTSCELTVEDNGIGFDPQYLERMFVIFQRLHSRSEYEGTGIGLAVCRKIVHHHGGTITAKSTSGQGATFIVNLPVDQPAEGGQS
jgi:signal transduction histidine kinase